MPIRSRRTKKTVLMVGEGSTERAFLQYLKELYISRDDDKSVKVEQAYGGSPECVVLRAVHLLRNRAYDKCCVLIDSIPEFKPDPGLESAINNEPQIDILYSSPCIEGLFLEILEHKGFSKSSWNSEKCKSEFERNYIPHEKKFDKQSYSKYFTREVLESRRAKVRELDKILSVFG